MNVFEEEAKELLIANGKMRLLKNILGEDIDKASDMELYGILGRMEDLFAKYLDEKMIIVVEKYYGLKDGVCLSYEEIAKELNMTANMILGLRLKAIRILSDSRINSELRYGKLDKYTVGLIRSSSYNVIDSDDMTIKKLTQKLTPNFKDSKYDIPLMEIDVIPWLIASRLGHAGIITLRDLFELHEKEGIDGILKIKGMYKRRDEEIIIEIIKKYSKHENEVESNTDIEKSL